MRERPKRENFRELRKKDMAKRDLRSRGMLRRMFVRLVRRIRDISLGRRNAAAVAAATAEIAADATGLADAVDATARVDVQEAAADAAGRRVLAANFPLRSTRQRLLPTRRMLRR